ncbi:MAG: hypothetical protein Q8R82_07135 [Hyphomonadaceae bacterium]|nr:hypothetical protein [Hyphomonadaceae bacterium]
MTEFLGWGVAVKIAEKFHERIRAELGEHLTEIDNLNAKQKDCCGTHLYCDPNDYMGDAFFETVGREINVQSGHDLAVFDVAWGIARRRGFSRTWGIGA